MTEWWRDRLRSTPGPCRHAARPISPEADERPQRRFGGRLPQFCETRLRRAQHINVVARRMVLALHHPIRAKACHAATSVTFRSCRMFPPSTQNRTVDAAGAGRCKKCDCRGNLFRATARPHGVLRAADSSRRRCAGLNPAGSNRVDRHTVRADQAPAHGSTRPCRPCGQYADDPGFDTYGPVTEAP